MEEVRVSWIQDPTSQRYQKSRSRQSQSRKGPERDPRCPNEVIELLRSAGLQVGR